MLLVALGGALGAASRYLLGSGIAHLSGNAKFPLGTFAVNVLGCLCAGVLAGLAEKFGGFAEETRLFLFAGVLGGFTTFSAFGLETVILLRDGAIGIAAGYVVSSVLCGLAALAAGWATVRWVTP